MTGLIKSSIITEGDTQSPEQALTLVSESGPGSISRALSERAVAGLCVSPSVQKELY